MNRLLIPAAALLWGLQISFLSPALALILTGLYGASTAEIGWVLAIYNASGFLCTLIIPAAADRRRDYLGPMLLCAVLTAVLAVVLALVTTLPLAVLALVVIGGPAGIGNSMLFAHLRHSGAAPSVVINTRAIVSVAWVAGPPIATALIGLWGEISVLVAVAVIAALVALTTVVMLRERSVLRAAAAASGEPAGAAEPAAPARAEA
ncbi:MFS transporter, partial [Brachybacterium hainanense]